MRLLTREQIRDAAERSAKERERAEHARNAPTPAEEKAQRDLAHRLMRRRAAIQRGYL